MKVVVTLDVKETSNDVRVRIAAGYTLEEIFADASTLSELEASGAVEIVSVEVK